MKRSPLKKVSDKRKAQLRKYWSLRKQFLKDNPRCLICRKPSREIHHKEGRWGKLLNDTRSWMALCWNCHAEIHGNPKLARGKGYLYR